MASGLFFASLLGLAIGFICGFFEKNITSKDIQRWDWSQFRKYWKAGLAIGLVFGLPIGFLLGLFLGLFFNWVLGLAIGLVYGFRKAGLATSFLLHLRNPYQRFWATMSNNFWLISTVFLAIVAEFVPVYAWEGRFSDISEYVFVQSSILLLSLSYVFSYVKSNFPQHFSLRLVLYLEGKMPLRVVTFMDRMSEQRIFEDTRRSVQGKKQRGATWRFRHKILQDYFAKPR